MIYDTMAIMIDEAVDYDWFEWRLMLDLFSLP